MVARVKKLCISASTSSKMRDNKVPLAGLLVRLAILLWLMLRPWLSLLHSTKLTHTENAFQ